MIISSSITIGEITFILRVVIQILAYGGMGLINMIILATVSRVAPIDTHDMMNRIIGASTASFSTLRWLFNQIRRHHSDPAPSTRLLLLLFLSISYSAFVALSDISFLGFHSCPVPSPDVIDFPASVTDQNAAVQLVAQNMLNDTDPSKVKAYKCDSTTEVKVDENIYKSACTNWHNSTYADSNFFTTNSTDSDAMMPRRLTHYPKGDSPDLNSYYLGPTAQRLTRPTIQRGLAVQPHDTGLRMIVGVPNLGPNKKVVVSRTLAVEVDVGCMSLGVNDFSMASVGYAKRMVMYTRGSWRAYTGPDYMKDVLSKTVDDTREYLRPFFNTSTLNSNGTVVSFNSSNLLLSRAAKVDSHLLPEINFDEGPDEQLVGNCSEALREKLGIAAVRDKTVDGNMCGFLGVGGLFSVDGLKSFAFSRMLCATATQVNMVDATIEVDAENNISVNITRLPGDLDVVLADYWRTFRLIDGSFSARYDPYLRYTLSPNPVSPTSHFVHQRKWLISEGDSPGPGSAGNAISYVGHNILSVDFWRGKRYSALKLLDGGSRHPNFGPGVVTKWAGEFGGSYFLASLGYNGWVALQAPSMRVVSTGGSIGTCYKPYYAIGFAPLVAAAAILLIWMLMSILSGSRSGIKIVEAAYGGVAPYTAVSCPGAPPNSTLLAWEASPEPHLQVIHKGSPLIGDTNTTVLEYLTSAPTYS